MTIQHRAMARDGARGQMMVVFGLTLTIFIGAMMLGIDLSRLRTEAENAQRAANAAALAGVIFLPDFPANAYYRANEEAHKNGFYDGQNGVTVDTTTVSGFGNRLKVSITEPVSLIFGGALGLGPKTISRTAIGEFDQPLQTGSPDNVFGYAPYPTTMVSPTVPEGFYLENKGPYTFKESGDAYSPLFESFNRFHFALSPDVPNSAPNPCTDGNPPTNGDAKGGCVFSNGAATTPNADHFGTDPQFSGYNYVINDPLTNTLMIKLFDPYDEIDYNTNAQAYDNANNNTTAYAPYHSGSSTLGKDSTQNGGRCYVSVGKDCTKLIDQSNGSSQFGSHPVTLEFTLSGPSISPYDAGPAITNFQSYTLTNNMPNCLGLAPPVSNCVYSPSANGRFDAGEDPTLAKCPGSTCVASPYAFHFVNYAIIHGPGYFRLNVQSVANADGTSGTRGNAYGIAVCGVNTSASYSGALSPNGLGATSDPYTNKPINAGDSMGWNASSCLNPNDPNNAGLSTPGACPHPNNPTPADQAAGLDKCIHIYGLGKMAIHNWLGSSGSTQPQDALVPLGMIPPEYAGKTLQVKLYDVGDITGGGDYVNVMTPAGDLSHLPGTTNGTDKYPAGLPYSYTAAPDLATQSIQTSGPYNTVTTPVSIPDPSVPITVTDSSSNPIWNGTWLNIKVPLNVSTQGGKTYRDMVGQFGGYWKMQYRIAKGATADDATTWEISVVGSPVHLVTG